MILSNFEKVLSAVDEMVINENAMAKLIVLIIKYLIAMANAGLAAGAELAAEDCSKEIIKECPNELFVAVTVTSDCLYTRYALYQHIRSQPITGDDRMYLMDSLIHLANQVYVAGYMYSVDPVDNKHLARYFKRFTDDNLPF